MTYLPSCTLIAIVWIAVINATTTTNVYSQQDDTTSKTTTCDEKSHCKEIQNSCIEMAGHLVDNHENCHEWSEQGECSANPKYMLENCQKSCFICVESETDFGEQQRISVDNDGSKARAVEVDEGAVKALIEQTIKYMKYEVMQNEKFKRIRPLCRNEHELCSVWASMGRCNSLPDKPKDTTVDGGDEMIADKMKKECAPACQTCDLLDECLFMGDDPKGNVWKPGDLNKMFEQINDRAKNQPGAEQTTDCDNYKTTVHSKPHHSSKVADGKMGHDESFQDGPWIVSFENFLTSEECDILRSLGDEEEFFRSEAGDEVTDYRTSYQTWCRESCDNHPVVRGLVERISKLTGVPNVNFEELQLLKYEKGQHYKVHSDYIPAHRDVSPGSRILTMFFYLNDVEDGGETRFPNLDNLTFTPKKGTALLWPSVLDENPNQKDKRTDHEALPVLKGTKYGANAWMHLRDFRTPYNNNCL